MAASRSLAAASRIETPATRRKRRRRKLKRIKKVEAKAAKDELLIDTPLHTKVMEEEKKPEEPKSEPTPESASTPEEIIEERGYRLTKKEIADPVEIREIREEIIERKPNVFPLEPPQAPPPAVESAEVQLLKAQLEAANLRAELAEARSGGAAQNSKPALTEPPTAKPLLGTHPMPKPEEFPPGAPPLPEMDPAAGDKTPAVIEWFKKHWPEQHAVRYAGRLRMKDQEDEEAPVAGKKVKDFQPSSDPTVDTSARQY